MTAPPSPCRVILLSGPGRAAVATVLVSGEQASTIVGPLFHSAARRPLESFALGRIVYGRWQSRESGEEVVVCRRAADRVEVHCHGGPAASAAIVRSLVEHGCREQAWQDWIRQTAADPIVAEARIALAAAPTERAALVLCDQLAGALSRSVAAIVAHASAGRAEAAIDEIDGLLAYAALGRHLTEPWHVVLAGRPNVGKSSLINALLGYQRAIVHATPGTTRDVVTARAAVEGWPIELSDTAGLRRDADVLETAGIELARHRMATADLLLLVLDSSRPLTADDALLMQSCPEALVIASKADLPQMLAVTPKMLRTSAQSGQGVEALVQAIAQRLVANPPSAGQAVPFAAWQTEALAAARRCLEDGRSAAALDVLRVFHVS